MKSVVLGSLLSLACAAFALTLAYFASAALADALRRRTTSRTPTGRR